MANQMHVHATIGDSGSSDFLAQLTQMCAGPTRTYGHF
jgi:hypothetical protein